MTSDDKIRAWNHGKEISRNIPDLTLCSLRVFRLAIDHARTSVARRRTQRMMLVQLMHVVDHFTENR